MGCSRQSQLVRSANGWRIQPVDTARARADRAIGMTEPASGAGRQERVGEFSGGTVASLMNVIK